MHGLCHRQAHNDCAVWVQVLSGSDKLFWGKPDRLQTVYQSVSDYLDLDERADVLNRRFSALTGVGHT
jgi:uncharacterized Rmd1/YagE family protein